MLSFLWALDVAAAALWSGAARWDSWRVAYSSVGMVRARSTFVVTVNEMGVRLSTFSVSNVRMRARKERTVKVHAHGERETSFL
ncbi:hypothetical protein EON66_00600 [archaeon]|nr:MAG: hypothetical protein EON66_00600 [archaeon]